MLFFRTPTGTKWGSFPIPLPGSGLQETVWSLVLPARWWSLLPGVHADHRGDGMSGPGAADPVGKSVFTPATPAPAASFLSPLVEAVMGKPKRRKLPAEQQLQAGSRRAGLPGSTVASDNMNAGLSSKGG